MLPSARAAWKAVRLFATRAAAGGESSKIYVAKNMNNNEQIVQKSREEILLEKLGQAGVLDALRPFGNVYSGREEPSSTNNPRFKDIFLGGLKILMIVVALVRLN